MVKTGGKCKKPDPQARYLINFSQLIFKRKLKKKPHFSEIPLIFHHKIKRMTAPLRNSDRRRVWICETLFADWQLTQHLSSSPHPTSRHLPFNVSVLLWSRIHPIAGQHPAATFKAVHRSRECKQVFIKRQKMNFAGKAARSWVWLRHQGCSQQLPRFKYSLFKELCELGQVTYPLWGFFTSKMRITVLPPHGTVKRTQKVNLHKKFRVVSGT